MKLTHIPPGRQRRQLLTLRPGLPALDPNLLCLIMQGAIQVSGSVGNVTFRRTRHGTVVMPKPDLSRVKWSHAQIANRQRFQAATARCRLLLEDPAAKARYTELARRAGLPVYQYVIRDLLRSV